MDDSIIARAVHVFSVVMWIGGVAFVTLVLMPSMRAAYPGAERLSAFHRIEGRFAPQARIWVLLAGASGFWMVHRGQTWGRFTEPRFWWMHAMVALWVFFMVVLFVAEPLVIHRRLVASTDPKDFARMETIHRILLAFSAVTVLGAVAGSHGLF
jgi:uncharacterized membrane protein